MKWNICINVGRSIQIVENDNAAFHYWKHEKWNAPLPPPELGVIMKTPKWHQNDKRLVNDVAVDSSAVIKAAAERGQLFSQLLHADKSGPLEHTAALDIEGGPAHWTHRTHPPDPPTWPLPLDPSHFLGVPVEALGCWFADKPTVVQIAPVAIIKRPVSTAPKLHWNCSETALELLWKSSESEIYLNWFWRDFCWLCWLFDCTGIALKVHWNCSESALELLGNCSETARNLKFIWIGFEEIFVDFVDCLTALELLWKCTGTALELKFIWIGFGGFFVDFVDYWLTWNCSETALELLRNCSKSEIALILL